MLSVKQENIKYQFLSVWDDSTWDRTLVSQTIGEHSNHYANGLVNLKKYSLTKWFQLSQKPMHRSYLKEEAFS